MSVTCSKINDWVNWGRLGNQLWALSHVIGYSEKHQIPWVIPAWKYSKYFAGPFNEVDALSEGYVDHAENGFHYNEVPLIHGVNMVGYWQSPRYWQHCEQEIRKVLTFKPELIKEVNQFIDIHAGPRIPVFVHVRRGDYVQGMAHYYHELTLDWYAQAMNHFDSNKYHFFICSDDITWCRNTFTTNNITFSSFDEIHDLCLMSECWGGGIMANSSFSFWGQFLINNPDKIIIAPTKDKWFKPVAGHNMDDLYYNQKWILL